jgi:hypothetical protein
MNKIISKRITKYKEQKTLKKVNFLGISSIFSQVRLFQLNGFHLQMFHNNINISAGGFFTVDMRLFFSVCTAETSFSFR